MRPPIKIAFRSERCEPAAPDQHQCSPDPLVTASIAQSNAPSGFEMMRQTVIVQTARRESSLSRFSRLTARRPTAPTPLRLSGVSSSAANICVSLQHESQMTPFI